MNEEGLQSGVRDEEQRYEDLILSLLCFKNSHRLASSNPVWQSGSPVVGSTVFCVFYCGIFSVFKKRRPTTRGGLQRECYKGEHQIQDVIRIVKG